MTRSGVMDGCLECLGLPRLPAVPLPSHLRALGAARFANASIGRCFVCTTCGLIWSHDGVAGWRRAPTLGSASEHHRAQALARFADTM